MKTIKFFLILASFIICLNGYSQSSYQLALGTSLPDNIINKYLKPGIYLKYGIDFKLINNLFLNTDISITYNNKNNNYKLGYEDEPRFNNNPDAVEFYEMDELDYSISPFYLFNSSLDLNLKYKVFPQKRLYPYFLAGLSANYSISEETLTEFMFDEDDNYVGYMGTDQSQQKFNIAYQGGVGINYFFKNGKAIFIETQYKLLPNIKFGRNKDRVGLFTVSAGINFLFSKAKKKDDIEN